jgi:hypothetical protein
LGIGHDIVIRLDDDKNQEYVLNNYYKADFGSYNSGIVTYQLTNLTPGKHKLFFRTWDLQNNSSTAELEFEVVESLPGEVNNMFVYPNPIVQHANIVVEHDRPMSPVDIHIYMYDTSGRTVYHKEMSLVTDASSKTNIELDLNTTISDGLYFIKTILFDENGKKSSKTTKIFVQKQ